MPGAKSDQILLSHQAVEEVGDMTILQEEAHHGRLLLLRTRSTSPPQLKWSLPVNLREDNRLVTGSLSHRHLCNNRLSHRRSNHWLCSRTLPLSRFHRLCHQAPVQGLCGRRYSSLASPNASASLLSNECHCPRRPQPGLRFPNRASNGRWPRRSPCNQRRMIILLSTTLK